MRGKRRLIVLGAAAVLCSLACVALALGLARDSVRSSSPVANSAAIEPVASETLEPAVDLSGAREIGMFRLRHYWIHEPDSDRGDGYPIFDPSCQLITRVPGKVRRALRMEGTGRLPNGEVINLWGTCRCSAFPCFDRVDRTRPWGMGVRGHHLSPFRTIAVDPRFVRIGTPVYVAELDGVRVPGQPPFGGFVHDGCVVAADRGRGIRGNKIDLFVADRDHFLELDRNRIKRVHLYRRVQHCLDRRPEWTPGGLALVDDAVERVRRAAASVVAWSMDGL